MSIELKLKNFFLARGYELLEKIGEGGTGKVYKARRKEPGDGKELVAIKVLSASLEKDKKFKERFIREMEIIQSLSHPNIQKFYSYDIDERENVYYVVMNYIEGRDLLEVIKEKEQLPLYYALKVVKDVCRALQYAHEKGLVHRDVKPGNILIDKEGHVYLTDFGMAKERRYDQPALTLSGTIMGTPYYLAPEQALSPHRVDIRADIYSLGITLYHMLAGRPPFLYQNPLRVITAHCYNNLPEISKYRLNLPKGIEELLVKMTQKEREKRYRDPQDLLEAVNQLEIDWAEEIMADLSRPPTRAEGLSPMEQTEKEKISELLGSAMETKSFRRRLLKMGHQLIRMGLITSEQLADLLAKEDLKKFQSLPELLTKYGMATEEEVARALAQEYNLPFISLEEAQINPDLIAIVPEEVAHRCNCLPIQKENNILTIAVEDPLNTSAKEEVEFSTGLRVQLAVARRTSLLNAIDQYYNIEQCVEDYLQEIEGLEDFNFVREEGEGDDQGKKAVDIEEEKTSSPIIKLVQSIMIRALEKDASDIHIEAQGGSILIRYRIDGLLHEEMALPIWLLNPLVSRIKIISELDIAEKRVPQDGRISFRYRGKKIICRVSTLPTYQGEKVVLRLLDPKASIIPLEGLGLENVILERLNKFIHKPQGIILNTGPTGCGKTTTLYSILNVIKKPELNIVTVEDPVEYELGGINQVQIRPKTGLTFAKVLRSILRQDPDVILVGEIRDGETADIALRASMTGHLVLSTLHTNDAPSTVTRLLDLDADPSLLGSSLELILAQRLVRKICSDCQVPHVPDPEIFEEFPEFEGKSFFIGKGCPTCDYRGFKGRIGVFEFMPISRKVKEAIHSRAKEEDIRQAAVEGGMITLWDSAIAKVQEGLTTIKEILRVVEVGETDLIPCPGCHHLISPEFVSCPYCSMAQKILCLNCRQPLQPDWILCPYCNTPKSGVTDSQVEGKEAMPEVLLGIKDMAEAEKMSKVLEEIFPQVKIYFASQASQLLAQARKYFPPIIILEEDISGESPIHLSSIIKSELNHHTLVFLLASDLEDSHREEAYLAGVADILKKPLQFVETKTKLLHFWEWRSYARKAK